MNQEDDLFTKTVVSTKSEPDGLNNPVVDLERAFTRIAKTLGQLYRRSDLRRMSGLGRLQRLNVEIAADFKFKQDLHRRRPGSNAGNQPEEWIGTIPKEHADLFENSELTAYECWRVDCHPNTGLHHCKPSDSVHY